MADTSIAASLLLDGSQATQSVRNFKKELKEAQAQALQLADAFGPTSKEALAAAKRVAELRDAFQDARETAALFDPGSKFQVFGNVLRTVTGGFSALTGSMALFGEQSEEVQKSLLRVQAALALVEGVNTIADSIKDFERLNAVIQQTTVFQKANAVATNVTSGAMRLLGINVNTTAASFQVLKGAIMAIGIGALVVAIGLLVEAFQNWTSAAEEAEEAQKKLNETVAKGAQAQLEGELSFISRQEKLQKAQAEARGATEKEINDIQVFWQKQRLKAQVDHYNQVKGADDKAAGESLKRAKDLEVDVQVTQLQYQKRRLEQKKEHDKKLADQAKEAAKKAKEQREQEQKEALEAEKWGLDMLQKLRFEAMIERQKNEFVKSRLQIIQSGEDERRQISEQTNLTDALRLKLLEESRAKQRAAITKIDQEEKAANDKKVADALATGVQNLQQNVAAINDVRKELLLADMDEFQRQNIELDTWYKDRLAIVSGNLILEEQLTREYEERKTKIIESQNELRLGLVSSFLRQGADLVGKQTAAGKVLAIASATIDTYQAANKALKADYGIFGPAAMVARIIAVTTTIATGLKNVREIVKTQVPGGGGAGGSVPSVGASAPAPLQPAAPTVTTTQLDSESLNTIGNAATRAYVVESDVTDQQEKIARISRAARLDG